MVMINIWNSESEFIKVSLLSTTTLSVTPQIFSACISYIIQHRCRFVDINQVYTNCCRPLRRSSFKLKDTDKIERPCKIKGVIEITPEDSHAYILLMHEYCLNLQLVRWIITSLIQ